jgi:hypothetical protein
MKRLRRETIVVDSGHGHSTTNEDSTTMVKPCRGVGSPGLLMLAVLLIRQHTVGEALMVPTPLTATGRTASPKPMVVSPLFFSATNLVDMERRRRRQQQQQQQQQPQPPPPRGTSTTALSMVLTTPESIIEQASTVNLLDDLIDESVRTSPRRPIMMQVRPLVWLGSSVLPWNNVS